MDLNFFSAILALLGALIGGIVTAVATIYVERRRRKQEHTHRVLEYAYTLGLEEFKNDIQLAKLRVGMSAVSPLLGYVIYNQMILSKMADGKITPNDIQAISIERDAILNAFPRQSFETNRR